MSDDLSIFQVTVTAYDHEGTSDVQSRYVKAEDFPEAITKAMNAIPVKDGYFVIDAHAEWMPDLEDIIE
jgi:hypothetical protein